MSSVKNSFDITGLNDPLYRYMAYIVEINTAAGLIVVGSFATLDDAKRYAAGLGVIRPLFPPTTPAADLIEMPLKKLTQNLTSGHAMPYNNIMNKPTRKDQPMNEALNYCRLIGKELEALENLLTYGIDEETMLAAYKELEIDPDIYDGYDAIDIWLNQTILEIKILKTQDEQYKRIEILRTCGGPHCEINRSTYDANIIEITTYDGTDQATTRNTYPQLAAYLDEITA